MLFGKGSLFNKESSNSIQEYVDNGTVSEVAEIIIKVPIKTIIIVIANITFESILGNY